MRLIFLYICYLAVLYISFWIDSDTPESDGRFDVYHSQIVDFNCYIEKINKGNGKRSRIYVNLVGEGELDFYLPHQECDFVENIVPYPIGVMFTGYFDGGNLIQLKLGNKELISFSEQKKRTNIFVAYIAIMPLICWLLVQYMKYRRS